MIFQTYLKFPILILIITLTLYFVSCQNGSSKVFTQCKVKSLTLINAKNGDPLNGTIIQEYYPIPEKLTLNLKELRTNQVLFLMHFEPDNCARSIKGSIDFLSSKGTINQEAPPFTLLGMIKTNIWGKFFTTVFRLTWRNKNFQ